VEVFMSRLDQVSRLAERLEREILTGKLAPGDRLPSERELSEQLGVSRSVVREALGRLASLGLVKSTHGSGTRVEAPSSRQVTLGYQRLLSRPDFRLEDLAEVRLPLETAIAGLAALKRTEEHLARLQETQQVLGNPDSTLAEQVQADMAFHGVLAEATRNPLFQTVLAPIQQLLIESRQRTLGRYGAALAHRHHARILAAVEAGDAAAAREAMREHLEANFQHLRQVGGVSNGDP
jgi:GntR family transcriptional repressor for pyruvate dehydrogenase complex